MRKGKGVAYALWLVSIFGWLGIHRFYPGKVGTGLIWLLTGGVLGIGSQFNLFTLGAQVDNHNHARELESLRTHAMVQRLNLLSLLSTKLRALQVVEDKNA